MTIRVAVNEAILLRGVSGSARAARQVITSLEEVPDLVVQGVQPNRGRSGSKLWNAATDAHWDLRGAAGAEPEADILVSPCNIGRASPRQSHLLIVYDVMVWESSHLFDPWFAAYARKLIPFSIRRADRVLTLSAHSREFLLELVPSADVHILTLPGRRDAVELTPWPSTQRTALMVGATAAHKNHVAGIDIIRQVRAHTGADLRLRIIGPRGRADTDVRRALEAADPTGTWTSREEDVTDDELDQAYATAWVLLQPSKNEGYGLPLVEASQRGLPVLHSGAGAMSEVLPESSVGTTEPEAFAQRLEPLLRASTWKQAAASVLSRAPHFSWEGFRDSLEVHVRELHGRRGSP